MTTVTLAVEYCSYATAARPRMYIAPDPDHLTPVLLLAVLYTANNKC